MAGELLGDREHPVVAYACVSGLGGAEPVIELGKLRGIVGPRAGVYAIASEHLLPGLQKRLGRRLMVKPGSFRIWWPGLGAGCDPADHPLVVPLEGESELDTLVELARRFDLSRPSVRVEIKLIEDARALAERELATAHEERRTAARELRDARRECERQTARADASIAALALAEPLGETDCEEQLHACISREWRALSPAERRSYPLGRYVLAPEFVELVERHADMSVQEVARVCAMLACGDELLLAGSGRRAATQLDGVLCERDDGAKRWMCKARRDTPAGPWVSYWLHPGGTIEFADISDPYQLGTH